MRTDSGTAVELTNRSGADPSARSVQPSAFCSRVSATVHDGRHATSSNGRRRGADLLGQPLGQIFPRRRPPSADNYKARSWATPSPPSESSSPAQACAAMWRCMSSRHGRIEGEPASTISHPCRRDGPRHDPRRSRPRVAHVLPGRRAGSRRDRLRPRRDYRFDHDGSGEVTGIGAGGPGSYLEICTTRRRRSAPARFFTNATAAHRSRRQCEPAAIEPQSTARTALDLSVASWQRLADPRRIRRTWASRPRCRCPFCVRQTLRLSHVITTGRITSLRRRTAAELFGRCFRC